jgi:hypothetical protein
VPPFRRSPQNAEIELGTGNVLEVYSVDQTRYSSLLLVERKQPKQFSGIFWGWETDLSKKRPAPVDGLDDGCRHVPAEPTAQKCRAEAADPNTSTTSSKL